VNLLVYFEHYAIQPNSTSYTIMHSRKFVRSSILQTKLSSRFKIVLSVILSTIFLNVGAQSYYTLKGNVLDEKDLKTPGATVFLTGTQAITATDKSGNFALYNILPGNYQLVVKMIGYKTYVRPITVYQSIADLDIRLSLDSKMLHEVTIHPDFDRDKKIDLFIKTFLGQTANAKECKLLNPEILDINYDKRSGKLKISSDEFLIIQNNALGYRIKYLISTFDYDEKNNIVKYQGFPVFEDLKGDNKFKAIWEKRRLIAYKGSITHFFKSLYDDRTVAEGFLAYKITDRPMLGRKSVSGKEPTFYHRTLLLDTLVKTLDNGIKTFAFTDCLYIVYNNENEPNNLLRQGYNIKRPEGELDVGQVSLVYLLKDRVLLDSTGAYAPTDGLFFEGYWAWERVADLLPKEYSTEKTLK
jgi:hypothetical protein